MKDTCGLAMSDLCSEVVSRIRQEEENLCKWRVKAVGLEVDSSVVARGQT